MAKYIKSHSNYVVAKKHQDINDGVVYERDITTIGGLDQFAKGQRPIYKSSNFIITVNNENEAPRDISLNRWQHTNDGEFWTLADIIKNKKTDTLEIKNKPDFYNLRDFAYYGSCTELIRASLNNIIKNFPGELYAVENPYDENNSEQEKGLIVYYCDSNGEKQILSGETRGASISQKESNVIQYKFLLDNPFNIDIHTPDIDIDETETNFLRFFANQSFINFDLLIYNQYTGEYDKNEIELWEINDPYTSDDDEDDNIGINEDHTQIENSSATKTCLQVGDIIKEITIRYGENPEEQFIKIGAFIGPDKNIVYLVSEKDLGIRIRPKEELIEYYFNNLDSFEEVLLNRDSTPLYKATFEIQKESPFGLKSEIIDFVFPKGYGDYNICVNGGAYNSYVDRLNEIGENYDELFCNNLYKSMTHESIKNFDWTFTREYQNGEEAEYVIGGSKIEKLIKLFGREFDEIKTYIDGLKNYNRITYNDKNNIPNYFLTDELENDGWDIVNIYPKTMHEYIINEYEAYIDVTDNLTPSERLRGVYENNSRDKNIEHVIRGFKDDDETLIKPYTSLNQYFSIYNSDEFFNAEGTQYFGYYLKDKDYTIDNTLTISGITLDLTKESPFYGYDEFIIDNEEDGTSYTSYNRSKDNKITFTSTFLNEKTGSYIYDEPNKEKGLGGCLKPKIMSYNSEKEYNMKEVNDHFMKMLKLNSKFLLRKKGTIDGIEEMLSLFGLRSKRWYDSLNPIIKQRIDEQRGDALQYDYEITETTSITPPIIDRWCDDRKMFYIDWCNYCKNITYNTEDFRLGIYTPYRGLPVSYETHFDSYRYLYPFFDSSKEIDGGMYYQMDGGWMSRAPYAFDSQDNLMINTEDNKCYKRTVKDILIVDNIQDLLSLPSTSLYNNQICKVLNMDGEYVIVDGELYDVYIEFSNNREYRFIEIEYDGSGVLSLGAINLSGFIKYSVRDNETMLLDVQDLRMGEKLRVYLQPILDTDFYGEFGEPLNGDDDTSLYLKTKDGFIVFDEEHKPILIDDSQKINELKEWNFTEVGGYFILDEDKNLIKRVDYDIYFDYLSERYLVDENGDLVFDEYFNLIPKVSTPSTASFDWSLDDDLQVVNDNDGIALADEPIMFDDGIALTDGSTPVADNLEAEERSDGYNDNPEQAEFVRQDGELDTDVTTDSRESSVQVVGYQILFNYANYDDKFLPIDFIYYTNKDIKESQYFKLIDKNYSNEISVNGWEQILYDSEDYKEYVLVQDYFNGNNPHNSQIAYDNGEAYMEKFYHLFGYSTNNNLFNYHLLHNESINIYLKGDVSNNEPYKQAFYMTDTITDVKNIGFHCLNEEWDEDCKKDYLKYAINDDPKIHYFGKVFDVNNLEYENAISSDETYREKVNYFTENVESDTSAKETEVSSINENDGIALASFDDLMVVNEAIVDEKENTNSYTKSNKDESMYALSWNNSTPLWEISDTLDNNSDQIVNTKVVTIKFKRFKQDDLYSKESVEEIKYLDSVIMHYVEQMIPSTTILQVDYDGLK